MHKNICVILVTLVCILFSVQSSLYFTSVISEMKRNCTQSMEIHVPNQSSSQQSVSDATILQKLLEMRREIHYKQVSKQLQNMNSTLSGPGRAYFQSHWEPTWKCEFEERVGNFGDGGKWVCDAYTLKERGNNCGVVSIGSNNDFGFEQAIHELNPLCRIAVFDHTVANPAPPPFVQYYSFGLGSQDNGGNIVTLDTAIQKAGFHQDDFVDVLKIDCEGCEYDVHTQFTATKYVINQILIEIHFRDSMSVHAIFQSMTRRKYVIFHKEPNTHGCSGDCTEYGFLLARDFLR